MNIVQNLDTEVEIQCSADAYPPPRLSLMARNSDGVQAISEQFQTSLSFTTSVTLTRESNSLFYFCRAEGSDPEYVIYSTTVSFSVQCKSLSKYICVTRYDHLFMWTCRDLIPMFHWTIKRRPSSLTLVRGKYVRNTAVLGYVCHIICNMSVEASQPEAGC